MKNIIESAQRSLLLIAIFSLLVTVLPVSAQNGKPKGGDKAKDEEKGLPLKPERKIEFTTDEGTWMSLDVSPDGKTVMFDLLGDLYTIPVTGGKAVRVTEGLPFDSQPRYSPDGSMIAFISDRSGSYNLWISKADGSEAKQISKEQQAEFISPEWTVDGNYVIVSKATPSSGSAELWMYHRQGGSGLKMSKGSGPGGGGDGPPAPGPAYYGAAPSSDGRYLYFAQQGPRGGARLNVPDCQIVRRVIADGEEDPMTFEAGNAFRPAVSPDGTNLVYGSRFEGKTGLKVMDLESGEERWLKYPVQRDEQESRPTRDLLPGYAFLPDGRSIIAAYGGKIKKIDLGSGEESIVPFSADIKLDIGPNLYVKHKFDDGPVKARLAQEPEVSPDGKTIAFSALAAVYTMQIPDGTPKRLTSTENAREFQPSFSPDGNWISFVTWSTKGGHIWKMRADGNGQPIRLTRVPAFYRDPVWSPAGDIVFALRTSRLTRVNHPSDFLGPQPGLDIVRIPSAGGDAVTVVPSRGLGKPHFGPEKDRLYVYGNDGLISFRFDGSDRKVHLKVVGKSRGARPNPARDVRISPDGTMAMALLTSQLYVFPVPRGSLEAPTIDVTKPAVPAKQLTTIGADSFTWADKGKTLGWAVGASFFRKPLADVDFEAKKPEKKEDGEEKKDEADAPAIKKAPEAQEVAITVERPRYTPKGTFVIRGAKAITMRGNEVIEDSDIVVTDNRIAGIGKRGSVTIPADAKVIDARGKTVIPGLIDIHAHWEVRHQVLDTEDYTFWSNLAYGVTTGRDPQTNTNDTFAYQDLVDTGDMIGPRIFTTGPGIFSDTDFQSYEEARDTIARYKKYYRTETLKSYLVGNRKQREWVVQASKELGIIPTTEGGSNFEMDLTHAVDGFAGNEHALPIVPIYNDVIQLFAKTGITYTPTLLVAYGGPQGKYYFFETTDAYNDKKLRRFNPLAVLDEKTARLPFFREGEYIFPEIAKYANAIYQAGGKIGLGGHGELQGLQCHWEMWALGMGGMKNHDILRVATQYSAEALGYGDELGSLEKGKMADLLILNGDPLADIRNSNTVRYVIKNGEIFEGDTLNQIWPENKPLPEGWWWKGLPE